MKKNQAKIISKVLYVFFISLIMNTIGCSKDDFQWNLIKGPEIGYLSLDSNNTTSFKLTSELISKGNDKNAEIGFCWSTSPNPTIDDNLMILETPVNGNFSMTFPWTNTPTYHFRSFVKNKLETVYSQDCIVVWPGSSIIPQIQTLFIDQISFYSFMVNCNVISTNGQPILSKGIELFDTPNVSSNDPIQTLISTAPTNSFNSTFTNLIDGETYYVRGFVKTIAGTGYGNILSIQLPKKYAIGETGPAGGIIIYENPDNFDDWHYIESAPIDIGGTYSWSPNLSTTYVNSTDFGQGLPNTESVFNLFGNSANYAAKIAINWSFNNYNDWCLPTLNELNNIKELMFNQSIGNLSQETYYWTSSEDMNYPNNAWVVKMSTTNQNIMTTVPKNEILKIRAVRQF